MTSKIESGEIKFNNDRTVRFNLDSFIVPVIRPVKKNTIYTAAARNVYTAKDKLTQEEVIPKYGFNMVVKWRNYIFAGSNNGIYLSDESLQFDVVTNYFIPVKMFIKNDRLFTINSVGNMLYYSNKLSSGFNAQSVMAGTQITPNEFGKCVGLSAYKDDLLLICEKALAVVDKDLKIKFLSNDCGIQLNNLALTGSQRIWESDWFGLGYATDTQYLRGVFIKTNILIMLTIMTNTREETLTVTGMNDIQKIKTNLRGDMFKLKISVPGSANFEISNVFTVITFGKMEI